MKLLDKFVFDFFQTLAFRFRQARHTKMPPTRQMMPYSQNVPAAPNPLFSTGKVYVRMKQAAQRAKVHTDMATPRMRLGNISEMMTHMVVASVMA